MNVYQRSIKIAGTNIAHPINRPAVSATGIRDVWTVPCDYVLRINQRRPRLCEQDHHDDLYDAL